MVIILLQLILTTIQIVMKIVVIIITLIMKAITIAQIIFHLQKIIRYQHMIKINVNLKNILLMMI